MTLTDFLLARIAEDERMWQTWSGALPPVPFLAECEAKRQIVQACTTELSGRDIQGAMMDGDDGPWLADHTLHTLALPYADHPDCRDEWRP